MTEEPRPAIKSIGVLGAGAWGTALAIAAWRSGGTVTLWARRTELADQIAQARENEPYLPGVTLDPAIRVTAELSDVAEAEALLLVVPAQHLRALAERLQPLLPPDRPLVICAKGIEQESGALMSEVLDEVMPDNPQAILTGPSFAKEVACELPTAVTLAARDAALGKALVTSLGSPRFRTYLSDDPVGAEIGGAVKNVIAIACGIVAGRKLGDNARAALITRALAEVARLGRAKGAKAETFMGLSGLGDLLLTCSSTQSRNYSLGLALGQGKSLDTLMHDRRSIVEGVFTTRAVMKIASQLGIEVPICASVDAVVNQGAEIGKTIEQLLARPFKSETI